MESHRQEKLFCLLGTKVLEKGPKRVIPKLSPQEHKGWEA